MAVIQSRQSMKTPDLLSNLEEFFKVSAEVFGIETAFLYGSQAGGFPRIDSDVDIAIVFSEPQLSDEDVFRRITDISWLLLKEVKIDVNVIPIYADFREPMLYYNAIVLGKPIFLKDFNKYVNLKNEAIHQMEDFNIFGRDWRLAVARKNLEELKRA